jgi:hypothetical protein
LPGLASLPLHATTTAAKERRAVVMPSALIMSGAGAMRVPSRIARKFQRRSAS